MAKRFTDTDKWKKKFIRGLDTPYKLLWFYILDDCDHSGIWINDFEVARLRIGEDINEQQALKLFEGKIFQIDDGNKWLILDFIEFQYGAKLNENNRLHQSVISTLKKFNLWNDEQKIIAPSKGHTSPFQGAKDKDKVKEKEKEKEAEIEIVYPFESDVFRHKWKLWLDYRSEIKKPYKSPKSEQAALMQLSEFNEEFAIKLIERSIASGYQGLVFENTKTEFLKNGKQQNYSGDRTNKYAEYIAQRFGNNFKG